MKVNPEMNDIYKVFLFFVFFVDFFESIHNKEIDLLNGTFEILIGKLITGIHCITRDYYFMDEV